jgi:hypothetical protein
MFDKDLIRIFAAVWIFNSVALFAPNPSCQFTLSDFTWGIVVNGKNDSLIVPKIDSAEFTPPGIVAVMAEPGFFNNIDRQTFFR